MMNAIYVRPPDEIPPQLSRADIARLSPAEIVQADDNGQCEVIRSGRDPLPFERTGERRATPAEAAQAIADQQAEADRAAAQTIREIDR
jgi:hypothetical protein